MQHTYIAFVLANLFLLLLNTQADTLVPSCPQPSIPADVLVVCFALDSPSSLVSAATLWAPQCRRMVPAAPILLVGTKSDLRVDPDVCRRARFSAGGQIDLAAVSEIECIIVSSY
ncbi:unnamed protein product [Protopolystoma xenopodis]|uniref:Uncharacterized protein n=1 Tax=Protopolystoma xenopodis TaxID=117903 RepID=A0A3S4ZU88_9PLAT|nr:unnamed protein product [Protopolystoma xenopodis]